jgi:hypothetical protein
MFKGINWLAVIVAVVLVQLLGFLWYGPLFGATWRALDPGAPAATGFDAKMICGILLTVIMVIGLAWLFARLAVADLMGGLKTALIVCIAFVLTLVFMGYCYEGQSIHLVAFNSGYELLAYLISGAVLGLMRPKEA